MPTYEYACEACGREFEAVKRMSDPKEETCPHCGADRTRRLISHSSFVLKGTGWYLTDYARKHSSGAPEAKGHDTHAASPKEAESSTPPEAATPTAAATPPATATPTATKHP